MQDTYTRSYTPTRPIIATASVNSSQSIEISLPSLNCGFLLLNTPFSVLTKTHFFSLESHLGFVGFCPSAEEQVHFSSLEKRHSFLDPFCLFISVLQLFSGLNMVRSMQQSCACSKLRKHTCYIAVTQILLGKHV